MHPHTASTQVSSRTKTTFTSLAALALTVLAAISLSACNNATPADTWVQPNQNAKNTRYIGGRISSSTIESVGVAWTADIKTKAGFGTDAPSPYITEENVFVEAHSGGLIGLDLITGDLNAAATLAVNRNDKPEWLTKIDGDPLRDLAPSISPLYATGKDDEPLVVGAGDSSIIAVSGKTVDTVWERTIEAPSGSVARVASNMASAGGQIYAAVVNVPSSAKDTAPTKLFNQLLTATKSTGQLVSISAEDGKVSWTKNLSSAPLGAATVANNIVFTTTIDGHIYGFDKDSGDQLWSSELPAGSVAPIAIYDDTIIVPASLVLKKGQKAQVVAFRIGGLGEIGGAEAPKLEKQAEGERAEATEAKPAEEAAGAGIDAKALFVANCAGCHVLTAAGTSGAVGPNLDQTKLDAGAIDKQITNGGGGMPAFKGTLSAEEIKAIAAYVAASAGK